MIIFENDAHEIHDVGTNSKADPTLAAVEVTDGTFDGWSKAKICCYKADVAGGNVISLTPYVDSTLIEHIDQLGREVEAVTPVVFMKTAYIGDTEVTFTGVPQGNMSVFVVGAQIAYGVMRDSDRVTVDFLEPLEEVTTVTISIM